MVGVSRGVDSAAQPQSRTSSTQLGSAPPHTPHPHIALCRSLELGASDALRRLSLDLNPSLGDAGACVLAAALRTAARLTSLSLRYSSCGPAGARALACALESPLCGLQALDLSGNALGAAGAAALARGARGSRTLRQLYLTDNGIGGGPLLPQSLGLIDSAVRDAVCEGEGALGQPLRAAGGDRGPPAHEASAVHAAVVEALELLGRALTDASCPLVCLRLDMNGVAAEDARALLPFVAASASAGGKAIEELLIDETLPRELFVALVVTAAAKAAVAAARGGGKAKKGGGVRRAST